MTQKVFNLVKGIATGVEAIAIAVVTYACDGASAAAVNAAIVVGVTAIIDICGKFVKE